MVRWKRALNSTLAVTAVIFASKLFGFVREIIAAGYFGTSMEKGAYDSAYSLFYVPVLLFSSCFTSTIVPMYVDERTNHSIRTANRFASNVTNLAGMLSVIVSVLMIVLAEPLVRLVYAGFAGEQLALTVRLTRIMLIGLVFFVVAIVLSSVLNARGQFMAAQLTGFPLSLCSIAATVFFTGGGVVAVAWSTVLSGILQILIMLPFLRGDFHYSADFSLHDRRIRRLVHLALPAILSMSVSELNHMVDRSLASGLNEADIPAMNYAFKLIMFLLGVIVVPIATVAFSRMSVQASKKDENGLLRTLRTSMEQGAFLLLPIGAICIVLAQNIIRAAYMRGAFDEHSLLVTSGVFQYYAVGLIAFGLRDILVRAFQAMQDNLTPLRVSCASMATNIALNLILREFMGVYGLALATSIAGFVSVVALYALLRKRLGGKLHSRAMLEEWMKIAIATAVAVIAALALNHVLPAWEGPVMRFLRLGAAGAGAVLVYAIVCYALKVRQLREIWKVFRRGA